MDELRISDRERQEAVDLLGEQYAQGRLTREEYDERSDAVWSARTRGDLAPVFVDLPVRPSSQRPEPPQLPHRPGPPAWRGVGRFVVPVLVVLLVLTVLTHLPFVLLGVLVWLLVSRRWRHHRFHDHRQGWARP